MSAAEKLDARNRGLLRLREIDNTLRALGSLKIDRKTEISALENDRQRICDALLTLGAQPWDFHPTKDNSWI